MTGLTSPLHVGIINARDVRFFKGPSNGPEMPWHAVEDLYQALGLPRSLRRELLRKTQAHWGMELRSVATADGPVVVAPHYVAQGLIGAAVEAMGAPPHVEKDYARAGVGALNALTGDLGPKAAIEFVVAAYRNTNGVDGGTP